MIHHVSVGTNDLDRAQAFYDPVMSEIGLRLIKRTTRLIGYGLTEIVFSVERPIDRAPARPGNGVHVAFHVGRRELVSSFHTAGLAHGGVDEGAPGTRRQYDSNYYAAFLRDPDGNKIEAVTFSAD
jgi:catechol 2,3-dioxygenase-like lactoylglutathione lyase family enzyme